MDLRKIITFCVFHTIIAVELVFSVPTFGNEFVHIKVHIPDDLSSTKHHVESIHPVIYSETKHQVNHKIIPNHHIQRRPIEESHNKVTASLWKNLYLAELNSHDSSHENLQEPKYIEETFLVKDQLYNNKQANEIRTFKIIEEYANQPHLRYYGNHVETIKLIENDHEGFDYHIESKKIVPEKSLYQQHPVNHFDGAPKGNVLKPIEPPKHILSVEYYVNYGQEPQVKEEILEEGRNNAEISADKTKQYGYVSPKGQDLSESQADYQYKSISQTPKNHNQESNIYTEGLLEEKFHNLKYTSFDSESLQHYATPSLFQPHSSNGKENGNATETYAGYDSYSADHVQGLGNGGYNYKSP